ncbi:transposase [Corynebacterium kalidii]
MVTSDDHPGHPARHRRNSTERTRGSGAEPTSPRTCQPWCRRPRGRRSSSVGSAMFQTIFQQPDAAAVWAQAREVVSFCEHRFPHLADYLEEALEELLAFTQTPKAVWTKVWSNDPTERLNRKSADAPMSWGPLVNRDAVVRLARVVLAEQHDDWIQQKRYMSLTSLEQTRTMMNADVIDADGTVQEAA